MVRPSPAGKRTAAAAQAAGDGLCDIGEGDLGFARIVALRHRSPTPHQIREETRWCYYF